MGSIVFPTDYVTHLMMPRGGMAPPSAAVLVLEGTIALCDKAASSWGESYDPPRPLQPLTSERMGEPMGRETTNALARELLESYGSELENWVPHLVRGVSAELGLPEVPIEHEWPVDIVAVVREFVTCVATDDLNRLGRPGGILEQLGAEAARGEIPPRHSRARSE